MKKKCLLYSIIALVGTGNLFLRPAEAATGTGSRIGQALSAIQETSRAIISPLEAISDNVRQAGQAFLAIQGARQTASDLQSIKQMGKTQLTKFYTQLAGDMERLLLSFFAQTATVRQQAVTILPYLNLALDESANSYRQVPTVLKPEQEPTLVEKAAAATVAPVRGVKNWWEQQVKGVLGERLGSAWVLPTQILTYLAGQAGTKGAQVVRFGQRMIDTREYLLPLKPVLDEIDQAIPSLIENLQTLQKLSELIRVAIPKEKAVQDTTVTPESRMWERQTREDETPDSEGWV